MNNFLFFFHSSKYDVMINAIIIEDEKTASDHLAHQLERTAEPLQILARLETVEDSVSWLASHAAPDLIFMDIHLSDGISFSIFDRIRINTPVIFVTAYDNYMVQAFEQAGIEYLLKPIVEQDVQKAIKKYFGLRTHFLQQSDYGAGISNMHDQRHRSRIIVRKGIEFQSIQLDEVAYFYTEQKLTFVVTMDNKKYMVDRNLKELEEELDTKKFYRANRKYIVHINAIRSYKPFEKIKLQLELHIPVSESVIVSQEGAVEFRRWIAAL
jgi:DNA-binding LytR/AlgR family response regulator